MLHVACLIVAPGATGRKSSMQQLEDTPYMHCTARRGMTWNGRHEEAYASGRFFALTAKTRAPAPPHAPRGVPTRAAHRLAAHRLARSPLPSLSPRPRSINAPPPPPSRPLPPPPVQPPPPPPPRPPPPPQPPPPPSGRARSRTCELTGTFRERPVHVCSSHVSSEAGAAHRARLCTQARID